MNHSLQGAEPRRSGRRQSLPGAAQLRQRHEQPARRRLRVRERGARHLLVLRPAVEDRRRRLHLRQHRVVPAGQLEGEQPADARLRPSLHTPAAAARQPAAGVEFLHRPVVALRTRRSCTCPAVPDNVNPCATANRQAMNPRHGGVARARQRAGDRHDRARHGQCRPTGSSRTVTASRRRTTPGPTLVVAPRFGAAYDADRRSAHGGSRQCRAVLRPTGWRQRLPAGRQSAHVHVELRCGTRRCSRSAPAGLATSAPSQLQIFQYDAKIPVSDAVEPRRADAAAVGDGARRVVCRQPRLQPAAEPARHAGGDGSECEWISVRRICRRIRIRRSRRARCLAPRHCRRISSGPITGYASIFAFHADLPQHVSTRCRPR